MIRAIALAARLDFEIEPTLVDAIRTHRREIGKSSQARLLEEYYKILRAGSSEKAFRGLADVGLLEPTSSELHRATRGSDEALWSSLAQLDAYRRRFESTPDALTNPILLGTLVIPLGLSLQPGRAPDGSRRASPLRLGELPLARRDVERLRQIVGLQRRLRDVTASTRAQHALAHRHVFRDALTWLEIHGNAPDVVDHWKTVLSESGRAEAALAGAPAGEGAGDDSQQPFRRRRRRRRRRRGHLEV